MVVAFGQSVDRFVMEFDHGCVAAGQCGTGFRRIVVENDSGRVLLDTLADKLAILERLNIRRVLIYPDSIGISPNQPIPIVVGGYYTVSFRPDSTCPPSGDPIVDTKQVRDAIKQAYGGSGAPPAFREAGGDVFLMDDGSFRAFPRPEPSASSCTFPAFIPQFPPGAVRHAAFYHSHAPENSFVMNCAVFQPGNPVPVSYSSGKVRNDPTGGLSPGDWAVASSPSGPWVYAFNGARLSRGDAGTSVSAQARNPNRWKVGSVGCFVK